MASIGGKRLQSHHVATAYRRNKMRLERGSHGIYRNGVGCGCGLVAVAASEERFVKNEVSEGMPIFHDTTKVFDTLRQEYGEDYVDAFMYGFDGDLRRGKEIDNVGAEDGAAAYETCVAMGIEEVGTPKEGAVERTTSM